MNNFNIWIFCGAVSIVYISLGSQSFGLFFFLLWLVISY